MEAELKYIKQPTNKICYMIQPEGIKEDFQRFFSFS